MFAALLLKSLLFWHMMLWSWNGGNRLPSNAASCPRRTETSANIFHISAVGELMWQQNLTRICLGGPTTSSFVWMSETWIHADCNRMTFSKQSKLHVLWYVVNYISYTAHTCFSPQGIYWRPEILNNAPQYKKLDLLHFILSAVVIAV
jgi:hypothetical protein